MPISLGNLGGKFISKDKFLSATAAPPPSGGIGFCDVVFGWDCHDACLDHTQLTGSPRGFPDALSRVRRAPYLAMAAVIAAGLHGMEQKLKLTAPPIHGCNEGADDVPRAARSLIETTRGLRQARIAHDWLGSTFVDP